MGKDYNKLQETNGSKKRFRFQKVHERVENLQTQLQLHAKTQSQYVLATSGGSTAPFREELALFGELYINERFQICFRQLRKLCHTTAQLLHHLQSIITILETQLKEYPTDADVMFPVLRLFVALARYNICRFSSTYI